MTRQQKTDKSTASQQPRRYITDPKVQEEIGTHLSLDKSLQIDHRRILEVPGNRKEATDYCVMHFLKIALQAINDHGKFFVALSGGSTPKAIYSALASNKYKHKIDWKKVFVFWSDERSVDPTHSDSNYKMAMDSGLKSLGIPPNQIFRMEAESDIQEHARAYQDFIANELGSYHFDLVMLGMGEDGHTASLFPNTDALEEKSRWVVANYVAQKETWRMTMTMPFINQANNIAVYVMGESKQEMLQAVLLGDSQIQPYPAQKIGSSSHPATFIADEAAAKGVLKKLKK